MIIVTGHLIVTADQRDNVVRRSADAVRAARSTAGCLDFAVSADSVDPERVNISERWTDRDSLHRFRGDGPDDESGAAIKAFAVDEYEIPDS